MEKIDYEKIMKRIDRVFDYKDKALVEKFKKLCMEKPEIFDSIIQLFLIEMGSHIATKVRTDPEKVKEILPNLFKE